MTAYRRPLLSAILAAALAVPAAMGVTVAAAAASEPDLTRAAAFVEVVRGNGCRLTEAEGATLLPGAGLDRGDAVAAVSLLNQGALFEVLENGETLQLLPVLCRANAEATLTLLHHAAAAGPTLIMRSLPERIDPDRAAALVGLIRDNGCAITGVEGDSLLPLAGFTPDETGDIATMLYDTGAALPEDGSGLRLMPALCDGAGVPDGLRMRALIRLIALDRGLAPWPENPAAVVTALEEKLRARACVLDISQPEIALPAIVSGLTARMGEAAPEPEAIASVLDLALGEVDSVFIHDAGRLRLADCSP